jgi:hypothetical protein
MAPPRGGARALQGSAALRCCALGFLRQPTLPIPGAVSATHHAGIITFCYTHCWCSSSTQSYALMLVRVVIRNPISYEPKFVFHRRFSPRHMSRDTFQFILATDQIEQTLPQIKQQLATLNRLRPSHRKIIHPSKDHPDNHPRRNFDDGMSFQHKS